MSGTPELGPRRVWRMTADSPQGKVIELPAKSPVEPSHASTQGIWHAPLPTPGRSTSNRLAVDCESNDETAKVLTPARAPTWQASSFDLLTGATAEEVTDTIPGDLYDELFSTRR